MNAEIISIGTEILLGDIVNTNSQYLAKALAEAGVGIYRQTTVGDNRERLLAAFETAFETSDMVVTTGGLGPTGDDLTKETAAEFFKVELKEHEASMKKLEKTFQDRPDAMEKNRKQGLFPEGALVLENPNGTAPGCILEDGDRRIIILPGPPHEMEAMFEAKVKPYLEKLTGMTIRSRILHFTGIGEWEMAARVEDLSEVQNPTVAPYAKAGDMILRITARAENEESAEKLIEPVAGEIRERLKDSFYSEGEENLEELVPRLLIEKGLTISTAESLTGGLIASTLVNCPLGISRSFLAGYVTYSNESKMRELKVREETIQEAGAVSEECAREMVLGCQKNTGSDIALSTTGIAGPEGGSEEKPAGLTYIGLHYRGETEIFKEVFRGDRNIIRRRVLHYAFNKLLQKIQADGSPGPDDGKER